jgi:eukaryotic-like serine/threonine-protein kinase
VPSTSDIAADAIATVPFNAEADISVAGLPQVERYALLEKLGAGSMGVVYAAYDSVLDRKVALKVLPETKLGERHRDQLLSEARALARLSHPNVVPVYDVGETAGRIFFAMEFIRGQHLADWLKTQREVSHIAAMFKDVALGLAAAHLAGLTHRDVKPHNLLVGDDGRIRVADFGLAIESKVVSTEAESSTEFAGSPAYMAPEQLRSEAVDARTDQFGLCVTFYEAFHGTRPFGKHGSSETMLAAIKAGPQAGAKSLPAWLSAAIDRGLSLSPSDRFVDCTALANALTPPAKSARRWWLMGAAVTALIAAIVVVVVNRSAHHQAATLAPPSCDAVAAALDAAWTPQAKAKVSAALAKSSAENALRLVDRLDAYATSWRTARNAACHSARIDHSWPSELEPMAERCLTSRLRGLERTIDALGTDEAAAKNPRSTISALRTVRPCTDPDYLRSAGEIAADPTMRAQLAALDDQIESLEFDCTLHRNDKVTAALPTIRATAIKLNHGGALAAIDMMEGDIARETNLKLATERHRSAYMAARAARSPQSAAAAATSLVWDYGLLGEEVERATDWAEIARAEVSAVKDGGTGMTVAYASGALADRRGDLVAATAYFKQASELAVANYGADHFLTATMQGSLASVLGANGQFDQALPPHRAAVAVLERWEGPNGLGLGRSLGNLALTESSAGQHPVAEQHARRALSIAELSKNPERIGTGLHNLGVVVSKAGRVTEAIPLWLRAEQAFTSGGLDGAAAASVVARIAAQSPTSNGERTKARGQLVAARAALVKSFGADAPEIKDADAAMKSLVGN